MKFGRPFFTCAIFAAAAAANCAVAADRAAIERSRVDQQVLSAQPFAVLSCENGARYAIRARAVSAAGDLVTGYLVLSPGRAIHIRLIPMADGYRYAGRGIWLDGLRGLAVLNFGKRQAISCDVTVG